MAMLLTPINCSAGLATHPYELNLSELLVNGQRFWMSRLLHARVRMQYLCDVKVCMENSTVTRYKVRRPHLVSPKTAVATLATPPSSPFSVSLALPPI